MPKVCHSSESWNPEVVDFKRTGFPIKNFGNDIFRLLQEPHYIIIFQAEGLSLQLEIYI